QVAISNLKVLGWGGSAQGDGQVSLARPGPELHLRARLHELNLAALLQSSRGQPRFIAQLHPTSRMDGTVEMTWTAESAKLKSKFNLQFSSPAAPPPGSLPISGEMQGLVGTNQGFSVSLTNLS